ncbi:MAG: thiamine pyrophosphate-binding protein, partial [Actinomycetota bacterium]
MTTLEGHGGDFVAEAIRAHGVDTLFTLSGGHIFPILDGFHTRGMRIVDVRHEQTAGFAAEAYGKLARKPGIATLTAGPGVTNAMSPIVSAHFNGSPMLVLGGRAPQIRWGQGSLQEMDHVPLFRSVTKRAETILETEPIYQNVCDSLMLARAPHRGPVFLDFPMDTLFSRATITPTLSVVADARAPITEVSGFAEAARALAAAQRPVILLGSDVWADGAEKQARTLVERHRIPAFMNGMGRGILPADHECALANARGHAFGRADLVIVAGTPLDFRLGFGSFGTAKVVHLADSEESLARHVALEAGVPGTLGDILEALADTSERDRGEWLAECRRIEQEKSAGFADQLGA